MATKLKIEKSGDEIKKKSSPLDLKLLSQSQPNFAEMILGWSPSKIVFGISDLQPRWPPQPQCDVTLDTTIPETLANYTPVLRDCECQNCAVNQSQTVTGSSIDQSDSVFHMSNTFSDESIDVVFEEPDIPSLQSVDIMVLTPSPPPFYIAHHIKLLYVSHCSSKILGNKLKFNSI
jgi:hypothetical protein